MGVLFLPYGMVFLFFIFGQSGKRDFYVFIVLNLSRWYGSWEGEEEERSLFSCFESHLSITEHIRTSSSCNILVYNFVDDIPDSLKRFKLIEWQLNGSIIQILPPLMQMVILQFFPFLPFQSVEGANIWIFMFTTIRHRYCLLVYLNETMGVWHITAHAFISILLGGLEVFDVRYASCSYE